MAMQVNNWPCRYFQYKLSRKTNCQPGNSCKPLQQGYYQSLLMLTGAHWYVDVRWRALPQLRLWVSRVTAAVNSLETETDAWQEPRNPFDFSRDNWTKLKLTKDNYVDRIFLQILIWIFTTSKLEDDLDYSINSHNTHAHTYACTHTHARTYTRDTKTSWIEKLQHTCAHLNVNTLLQTVSSLRQLILVLYWSSLRLNEHFLFSQTDPSHATTGHTTTILFA